MTAVFHPDVQQDVRRIFRHYDRINPRLGDEFWTELMAFVEKAAAHPQRFHFDANGRRRVNLRRFPYHFFVSRNSRRDPDYRGAPQSAASADRRAPSVKQHNQL